MGGLKKWMPVTRWTFLIACFAIAGLPLVTAGFFSKDEILWFALANRWEGGAFAVGPYLWAIGLFTAGLTTFYMFRLYCLVFEGECRADQHTQDHLHESPKSMTVPLMILAGLSICGGWIGFPEFVPFGHHLHHFLHGVIEPAHGFGEGAFTRDLPNMAAVVAMCAAILVFGLALLLAGRWYYSRPWDGTDPAKKALGSLHGVLENKYHMDEIYDRLFVRPLMATSRGLFVVVDRLIVDTMLVGGIAFLAKGFGLIARQLQNGDVQRYAFFVVFGLTMALWIVLGMFGTGV